MWPALLRTGSPLQALSSCAALCCMHSSSELCSSGACLKAHARLFGLRAAALGRCLMRVSLSMSSYVAHPFFPLPSSVDAVSFSSCSSLVALPTLCTCTHQDEALGIIAP